MFNIAIDGPGGAGKSTVAKAVAKELKIIYVDTGALYRAVGVYALDSGVEPDDREGVSALLENLSVELRFEKGEQQVFVNGKNVSGKIRTPKASMAASNVSAIPEVRKFLFDTQRDIAKKHSVIMDGRDIGTVVLPDADVKIFLTASPEARAKRRFCELKHRGIDAAFGDVLRELKERDYNDSHREIAPLKAADDAVTVDTDKMTLKQEINAVLGLIKDRLDI